MRRIIAVMILIIMTVSFLLPFFNFESCAMEQKEIEESSDDKQEEVSDIELSIIHMNKEMDAISHLKETDKLEWYKKYRNIVCKYKYAIGVPNSIFDVYTENEIRLICKVVETECHGQDFSAKTNVASVIFNRIDNGKYGSNVEDVIKSPNQFAYWRETIQEDTLFAVMYSFEIQDTTNGCVSFHSNEKTEIFGGKKYVFTDSASHHFYR